MPDRKHEFSSAQAEAFVATVETGSLTHAAKRLNLTPSAISKQLAALETHLGITLLERNNRSVILTDAGRIYFDRCIDILTRVRDAHESLLAHRNQVSGPIHITASTSLSRGPVMASLTTFAEAYPDIRYELSMTDDVEDLVARRLDFAFRLGKLPDSRLRAIPLMSVQPMFCASLKFVQRHGSPTSLADLARFPCAFLSTQSMAQVIKKVFDEAPLPGNIHLTDDIATLDSMVSHSMCIGAMLNTYVQDRVTSGEFIDLFPERPLPGKRLYLVYAKQGVLPKKLRLFKEHINNYFSTS